MKTKRAVGLYVHLPFCHKKCSYCDFYSVNFYAYAEDYIDALLKEATYYRDLGYDFEIDTVYFGGGTPSSLNPIQLTRLISGLFDLLKPSVNAEITLEANPATLDREKLEVLKACGVSRMSMGVQSANNAELRALSRRHSFDDFLATYRLASEYFDNISLDLMFGLPDQTLASFENTLQETLSLSPKHISLYALKVEENTPFGRMGDALVLPDEDAVAEMYLLANRLLTEHGFEQYEISNYARQGCCSKHNLRYWQGKEYIGLGAAAHSYFDGVRYANSSDILSFIERMMQGKLPMRSEEYRLTNGDRLEEAIILPLRLTAGLDLAKLQADFGYDLYGENREKIDSYIRDGFMQRDEQRISFTPRGFLVSNTILSELLP